MDVFETITSWSTPTVLFCILNLMILIIFFLNPHKKQQYPPLTRVPSLFDRVRSINRSDSVHKPELARSPSILERVKSINLSFRSDPQPDPVHYEEPVQEPEPVHEHVIRTKSETVWKEKKAVKKVLRKSASEKAVSRVEEEEEDVRRPETVRERVIGDEEVDEKADDFINKFRQQLKLQRLDSILRYKEMLNRGVAR